LLTLCGYPEGRKTLTKAVRIEVIVDAEDVDAVATDGAANSAGYPEAGSQLVIPMLHFMVSISSLVNKEIQDDMFI
jgi:hypothetical protein